MSHFIEAPDVVDEEIVSWTASTQTSVLECLFRMYEDRVGRRMVATDSENKDGIVSGVSMESLIVFCLMAERYTHLRSL